MDNFAIDLDSVLNELERQESIEGKHGTIIYKNSQNFSNY